MAEFLRGVHDELGGLAGGAFGATAPSFSALVAMEMAISGQELAFIELAVLNCD